MLSSAHSKCITTRNTESQAYLSGEHVSNMLISQEASLPNALNDWRDHSNCDGGGLKGVLYNTAPALIPLHKLQV